jgi:hypothetical protein
VQAVRPHDVARHRFLYLHLASSREIEERAVVNAIRGKEAAPQAHLTVAPRYMDWD